MPYECNISAVTYRQEMASHNTFTPGMCSVRNVTLYISKVSTSGRMMCTSALCLLVCLLITATTAELSQWKTMCAFVNLCLKMFMARNTGYSSSTVISSCCQF